MILVATLPLIGLPLPSLPAAETSPAAKPVAITRLKRSAPVDFDREILPILKNNCLACHNRTTAKAKLSLETPEEILRGGDSGAAAIPRQGAKSLLVRVAAHQDEDTIMPPKENKVQAVDLTSDELGLIKLWIDQGAKPSTATLRTITWQPLPDGLNPIYAVALSPDGRLAAAARANQIFLYDLATRRPLTRLTDDSLDSSGTTARPGTAHRSIVSALAFDPEGDWLASGSHREVKLWRRLDAPARFTVDRLGRTRVESVAVSPDGRWIAASGDGSPLRLLDANSGKPLRRLRDSPRNLIQLQPSPNSRELAAISGDGMLRIWDVGSGDRLAVASGVSRARSLAWLAEGDRLAIGDDAFRIRVLHLDRVRRELFLLRELRGHEGPVTALAAVPGDPTQLYSASGDGTIRLWNLEDGQSSRQLRHGDAILAFAISPDGKHFASAGFGGSVRLWDSAEGKVVSVLPGDPRLTFRAAQAQRLATFLTSDLAYYTNTLNTAEAEQTAAVERTKKAATSLETAAKARDEKQKLVDEAAAGRNAADKALEEARAAHAKARESAVATTNQLQTAEAGLKALREKQPADTAAIAEAEKALERATAARDAATRSLTEGAQQEKQAGEKSAAARKAADDADNALKKALTALSTAETEDQLARKGAEAAALRLADARTGMEQARQAVVAADTASAEARRQATSGSPRVRALAFSPDSRRIATGTDAGKVHLWSAEDGTALGSLSSPAAPVATLAFATTNAVVCGTFARSLALLDTEPRWELAARLGTGNERSAISDRVNVIAFSPDGHRLATGGGEPTRGGEILLWDLPSGRLLQSLTNVHSDAVFALDFSPDGRQLASGAADKFARITDLATAKVIRNLEGHTHHVLGISWKQDGRTLATAGADNVVKIWNVPTGERKRNVTGHDKEVTAVRFIPCTDQFLTASGDTRVRLIKDDGNEVRSFPGSPDFIQAAGVSADAAIVIAGGQDSVLRIWNGTNGQPIATFAPP